MKSLREVFWWCIAAVIVLISLAAVGALWPVKAQGGVCAPFEKQVAMLEREHQEQMIGAGIAAGNESVLHLFMHRTGKTWSLLRTTKDGNTCFVAVGTDWTEVDAWEVKPQNIDHHYSPPHSWIQPKKNKSGVSCCGKSDIVEVPHWKVSDAVEGSEITVDFPFHGTQTITVQKVFPTEDNKSYVTYYGCVFKHFGI